MANSYSILPPSGASLPYVKVNAFTSAAIQSAINATSAGDIVLPNGTYILSSPISLINKSRVRLISAGGAVLQGALGSLLEIGGTTPGSLSKCAILGLEFISTATGSGNGLIAMYENAAIDGLTISDNTFSCPTCNTNAISGNTYSAITDGGSGSGNVFRNLIITDNRGTDIGRMFYEQLNHGWNDGDLSTYRYFNINFSGNQARNLGVFANDNDGMMFSFSGLGRNVVANHNQAENPAKYAMKRWD